MEIKLFKQMRNRVIEIDLELKRLKEEKEQTLHKLQEECNHDLIIEFDNHTDNLGNIRLCVVCGLKEEHEGCGFSILLVEDLFKWEGVNSLRNYNGIKPLSEFLDKNRAVRIVELIS